jgi:deoxyadenosine/deoxycytidine kinase
VVYLYADTPVLMERIALRDRTYERNMSAEYIESLVQAYEMFFAQYSQTAMLRLNTHALDIVHRPVDLEKVLQRVRSALRHGAHQMALPQFKEL